VRLFNGFLVTRFNLSSIVITIGTMSLYRGITYILLGDQALNAYPESFAWFGQGYVFGALSFEFALFIVLAAVFAFVLHRTNFGRRTYAIGNNPTGAWYSGINVKRHNLILFALVGLMAGGVSIADIPFRQYAPDDCDGLGTGGGDDGGAGWRQYPWRFRQHGGRGDCRLPDGAGDLWSEPAQRTGDCDVDYRRRDADRGDFPADYLPPGYAAQKD
jgi:hypothetical protein